MPDIPDFVNQESVHPGGAAQISPGALGAPAGAAAQGAERVSAVMNEFNARYHEAARASDAASTMSGVTKQLGDIQFRASKIPNRQQALDAFDKEAGDLRTQTMAGIKDPLVGPLVQREFDSEAAMRSIDTGQQAFRLESSARNGALDTNQMNLAESYAGATSDAVRAKIHDNAVAAIRMNVQGGWLSPEEGAQRELKWGSDIQEVQARHSYNDALATQDPDKAMQLSAALADPKNFPGLLPERREILTQHVDQLSYRLEQRQAAALVHQDATAERNQRLAQNRNEATLLGGVYTGKTYDPIQLDQLAQSGQISAGGLETIHGAMDRQARGSDEGATVVRLWHSVDTGQAQPQDVYDAIGKGISSETGASMVRALDAKGPSSNAAERSAFNVLKTAMHGQAVEAAEYGSKGPEVDKWAQAQGEWHSRVTIGGQNPTAALNDMMNKYSPTRPSWLAQPKFGAVQSFADLQHVGAATQAALAGGQITEAQAEAQGQLLKQYSLYYRAAPPAHGAKPPKPAAGGATP